ncbi:rhomboid family intramembrane serine protease [Chitinophaga sp. SYP-B3965]|uniref:rhomboid family intramembrane serine protease n=1 Tax=Chitinophaga sp. SYP-B3965 TaxID=2663120 RepID=UPI00129963F9|nr:rhomboid family intramembrane serine protease [Chitinophaga sp. SYP-B3965]MRG47245.1 rhomboid family intramembrane serine protease [Chitinophaga sp. SYP-B3965]
MNGSSIKSELRMWIRQENMVTYLIITNIAVFLIMGILRLVSLASDSANPIFAFLYDNLSLHTRPDQLLVKPWGFITYMFTHYQVLHILFNLLMFFFFGNLFRSDLSNRRVLPLYLLGGLIGGILYVAVYNILPSYSGIDGTMVGASAAIMTFIVASSTLMPNLEIALFGVFNIRLKWLALGLVVIDLFSMPDGNLGGLVSHLGGAAFGFAYIRILKSGTDLCSPLMILFDKIGDIFSRSRREAKPKKFKPKKSPLRVVRNNEVAISTRLDELLDKINEKGLESLTSEEKLWLKKHSEEK